MAKPVKVLYCHFCGKSVSTGFRAVPTDTPDRGIIIRAIIICPECIEQHIIIKEDTKITCPVYRPDHNGECILCDEYYDDHSPEAVEAGKKVDFPDSPREGY